MSGLIWTPHPVWPTPVALGRTPEGKGVFRMSEFRDSVLRPEVRDVEMTAAEYGEFYRIREEKIRREKENPFLYGVELPAWRDADALLLESRRVCIFGGNRAGKTDYCTNRPMKRLVHEEGRNILWLHNNELASKEVHQKYAWRYMPPEWKNLKRSSEGNIRYDPKNKFSDNIFVAPTGGTAIFGNYEQALDKYEGLEFDMIIADENLPLLWYKALLRGLATRGGSFLWAFTPVDGMTPAVAEVAGGARTRKSRPVDPELLDPALIHVDDCPPGHMPYIAEKGKMRIIYFHSDMNPYGGYENLKELYGDQDKSVRERRFYGYARKLMRVLFPKFGDANILTRERMALILKTTSVTRYHVADPAGARNMFQLWVAVDKQGRHYFYREWPNVAQMGEWAVPSENAKKWDGDAGPAQPTLGLGVVEYKRLILEAEGWKWSGERGWVSVAGSPLSRVADAIGAMTGNQEMIIPTTEEIYERIMDPRSGAAQSVSERDGGASLMDRFEEEQLNRAGVVEGPSMVFVAAPGLPENDGINGKGEGIQGINDLLSWDQSRKLTPLLNEPKFYVSEDCENLIWALMNYTGNDGAKAACKDPIDCCRYIATSKLEYVDPQSMKSQRGGYY